MQLLLLNLTNISNKQCCLLIAICYLTISVGCSEQGVNSTEDNNSPMEVSWQAPALVELGKPAKYSIEIEDKDGIDSLRISLESADGEHDTTIVETPNSNSYKGSWSVISSQQGDHLFRYFGSDKLAGGDEFDSTYVTAVRPFENYTRKGTVHSDITHEPIENTVLRISRDGKLVDEDTTSTDGIYALTVRQPRDSTRTYLLIAQRTAYQDYEQTISISSDQDNYGFTLKPNPVTYDYKLDLVVNPGDSVFVKRGDIIGAIDWGGAQVDSLGVISKGELYIWRDQQNGENGVWFKPNEGVTTDQEYGINAKSSTGVFETFTDTLHVE